MISQDNRQGCMISQDNRQGCMISQDNRHAGVQNIPQCSKQ